MADIRLIWAKLISLFSIFEIPEIPVYGKAEKQQHTKQIVEKLARGNVYLQLGYYETKEDILEQKKLEFAHK